MLDVLEKLTNLNDDLQHSRARDLVRARIAEVKVLLDRVEAVECQLD